MIDSWLSRHWGETLLFGVAVAGGYMVLKLAARPEPTKAWFMAPNKNAQMHVLREVACDHTHCSFKGLQRVQQQIDGAEKSIDVMMYFLTYAAFTNALLQAKKRGVKLRLILQFDRSDEGSEWVRLRRERVPIRMMDVPPSQLQHVKMLIFDQTHVMFGSMNYTFSGLTENEEEMLVRSEPEMIRACRNYFNRNWELMSEHDKFLAECKKGPSIEEAKSKRTECASDYLFN